MSIHLSARLARSTGTLAEAAAERISRRSLGVHNPRPPKVSAHCQNGNHSMCFSLNCTCTKCRHGVTQRG